MRIQPPSPLARGWAWGWEPQSLKLNTPCSRIHPAENRAKCEATYLIRASQLDRGPEGSMGLCNKNDKAVQAERMARTKKTGLYSI